MMQISDDRALAKQAYLAHLALLTVQILFGTLPVIGKTVLQKMPAISLVGVRVGVTAMALILIQRYRGNLKLIQKSDYLKLFLLSFFGVTFNQILFIGGLSLTKASNVSLLAATIPIFTFGISSLMGNEAFYKIKLIGILTAACGVLILTNIHEVSFSSDTTIGDLMIILNSLSYGIYVAISKNVILRNGPIKSVTWLFVFASIFCVPIGMLQLFRTEISSIPFNLWMLTLYIAIFATLVPYLLNAFALTKVNPSSVAVYIYLQPLIGFLSAVLILKEEITTSSLLAAIFIMVGVFLTTKPHRNEPSSQ